MTRPENDASKRASLSQGANNYPYTPSIASSASSSFSSVWSADGQSSQSSAPSSVKSATLSWDAENTTTASERPTIPHAHAATIHDSSITDSVPCSQKNNEATYQTGPREVAVAPELRVHPRRTQTLCQPESSHGPCSVRQPPALVRQCDRKDRFVECLVGRLTQCSFPKPDFGSLHYSVLKIPRLR